MITPTHIRSMRDEMQKIATKDVHGKEYEQLTRPRLIQALKDGAVVAAGTGLGYGVGRTFGELGADALMKTPEGRELFKAYAPVATMGLGALLTGGHRLQAHLLKRRRDKADRLAQEAKRKRASALNQATPPAHGAHISTHSPQFARTYDRSHQAEHSPRARGPANLTIR